MSIPDFLLALSDRQRGLADPQAIVAAAVAMLGRHLEAGRVGWGEIAGDAEFFAVEHDAIDGVMPSLIGQHRRDGFGPVIRELRAGRAIRLEDALAEPGTMAADVADAFVAIGIRAGVFVPVMNNGQLAAALYAHQAEPRHWRDDELILMQEVAQRTWEAVERARVAVALRESEAKLRDVLDGIGEAFYALDRDLCFLHASRAALEFWGKEAQDLMGKPIIKVFPHAAGTPAYEAHRRVLQTGKAEHFETISPLLGRWFEVDIHPSSAGLSVAFRDIQRRKQAEEALQESEARLQAAVDLVGLSLYAWDLEAGVLEWDARLKAMWGLPPEAEVDLALARSAIHPDDRPQVEAAVARATDPGRGGVYQMEYRVIGIEDGVERWVSSYGRATFVDGKATRFTGAVLDITARKQAEEQLRDSEERFRLFAEHSTNVLWIVDAKSEQIEYLSPVFARVWGAPSTSMLQQHWREWVEMVVHPDDRENAIDGMERSLRGEIVNQEYRIIRADGAVRWLQDALFPIHDKQGRVRWVGGIAQDMTRDDGSLVYIVGGRDTSHQTLSLLLQGTGYQVKVFESVQAFLDVAPALVAGCVLIGAPEARGLTVLRELKARRIELPVIVLGENHRDVRAAVQAMKAGAADFLEMPIDRETLLAAVASALAGIREGTERDHAAELARARLNGLSAREREVLEGLLAGGTNKSIGTMLGISSRTVEIHRAHLMQRLGVSTLTEVVLMAVAAGLQLPAAGDGGEA
ncbi:MAG TPA: PAS domain S-box protein [Geminicoccus sp.]|jgi:PAS domain S-box-containing protein|uniref:PAS domain S-box protein n=1 Tax=Geminicoccus sp. TaxID=2024832 RepID=UPI002E35D428|nr:PAS domain S-box protein [Geminicoccus sp.]HEX2529424.1 PAS domain S-box protein [Geminicoccus sp.]